MQIAKNLTQQKKEANRKRFKEFENENLEILRAKGPTKLDARDKEHLRNSSVPF